MNQGSPFNTQKWWCHRLIVATLLVGVHCSKDIENGEIDGTLAGDAFQVENPRAGEAILSGTLQTVSWSGDLERAKSVAILLKHATGTEVLATEVPNSGKYQLQIPLLDVPAGALAGGVYLGVVPDNSQTAGSRIPGKVPDAGAGEHADAGVKDDKESAYQIVTESAAEVRLGSLAAFLWNGKAEDYYWFDVLTGKIYAVGTVGDLMTWTMNAAAVDNFAHRVYVLGNNASEKAKVYTLDAYTGELVADVLLDENATGISGLGVNGVGELLGYRWNGKEEELVVIDATDGGIAVRGIVGDLMFWSSESTVNQNTNVAYILGIDAADVHKIYSMDTRTGDLIESAELASENGIMGLDVNEDGSVFGCQWNGSFEEFVVIDPKNGEVTVLGQVGDLEFWSGVTGLNRTNNTFYVIGTGKNGDRLYAMDSLTGELLYDVPASNYPTTALLIY